MALAPSACRGSNRAGVHVKGSWPGAFPLSSSMAQIESLGVWYRGRKEWHSGEGAAYADVRRGEGGESVQVCGAGTWVIAR